MELLIDFILIVGIVLNISLLLKLFKANNKQLPKKILIVFWFFILFTIIHFYAILHQLNFLLVPTFILEKGSRFLLAVLVYLYVTSLFEKQQHFIRKNAAHFIPFTLYFLFYVIPASVYYVTDKTTFLYIQTINKHVNLALIKDSYGLVYLFMSLQVFNSYKPRLKQFYSNFKEQDFLWIRKFIILFLIALSVDLVMTLSEIYFGYNVSWDGYITVFFVIAAMGYLGYFGLTQTTLFLTEITADAMVMTKIETPQKIIKPEEELLLTSTLDQLFNEEKIHLNKDLNLNDLSQKMHISSRKLSAFLNEVLHTTFYDKVNQHRVEEATKMLVTDKVLQYTIIAIGDSCGFNSKSSFYRIFKKSTGYSPSEYRRIFSKK